MTEVAVIGFAQSPCRVREDATTGGVEMLVPIFAEVYAATGLTKGDIGFWCSGSSDYLAGRAFSFVQAVDAIGAVPPIMESHVEMDGAWALYEAWVKIMSGEAEIALAYGFGKSSGAELRRVLALQLDPYLVAPLWPDAVSVAALQARLGIEAGLWTEKDMAQVAARCRAAAVSNPAAQVSGDVLVEDLLGAPYVADPLRAHDCAPVGDGAAVVILASGARARELCERPAWITSLRHRIESGSLGARDLLSVGGRPRAGRRTAGSGRRVARAVHPPGDPAAPGAAAWTARPRSTRRAARSAATRCSPPGSPGSAARRGRSCPGTRHRRTGARDQRARAAAEPGLRHGGTMTRDHGDTEARG